MGSWWLLSGGNAGVMLRPWFMRSLFLFALVCWPSVMAAQAPLRVVSFNIRYGTARDGAHEWPNRRAHLAATIRDHAPHLLGVQEALRFQLDELAPHFTAYREIGVGRDDGVEKGEYSAILVDTARFEILTHGQFWFSDTPDTPGSMSWGNRITRLCTWARIVDRTTGDTLRVYNQHWDHESQPSRERSAQLLLSRIAADGAGNDRIIVMGDFNSGEDNPAYQLLLSDSAVHLADTFRAVHPQERIAGTFNGFKGDSTGEKIDAILVGDGWAVIDAMIDRRRFGALWASDHFAVTAILRSTPARLRQTR